MRWPFMGTHVYERSDAEARLAELMTLARKGERVLITENGALVARLVPGSEKAAHRRGEARSTVKPSPEFEPTNARLERLHAESAVPRALRKTAQN